MRRSCLIAALCFGPSSWAHAAVPDVWDVAAVPRLASDSAALREAQRVFLEARDLGMHSDGGVDLLRVVKMILERVDAASAPDPRLGFLYGRVLVDLREDARASVVLRSVLARADAHPDAGDAWFTLAIACARLGDTRGEIDAYRAQLAVETDPTTRAITLSNQAEGYMVAGDLDSALARYRESVALLPDNALSRWGLAVALDRSGDPHGALSEARAALAFDPDARRLSSADVFFVPEYDRYWYFAIATAARAQGAPQPGLQVLWWERAVLSWRQYIDAASPADPWLATARVRLAMCQRELHKTRLRAHAAPPTRP